MNGGDILNCYNHNGTEAVSQCVDCGKGLCLDCTRKYSVSLCNQCALVRLDAERNLLIKNFIIMIILFFVGLVWGLVSHVNFFLSLLLGYYLAGTPWGWGILTRITPRVFLFLPLIGWLVYFVAKFMIALVIGAYILPFKIYRAIRDYSNLKKMENFAKHEQI